jgi:hypothetical protein
MRLKSCLKGFFIFGLILFLGVLCPMGNLKTAYANGTQEIKLNVNSQTIVKGKTLSLYVYNLIEGQEVTFVSSNPAIASVDEYGVVTGNLVGTATILVTVTEGENTVDILSCDIKVGPPAISVQFSRLELAMTVGQKITLERIILPLNTVETAKFSSYDRTIATVSAGGRVTAKAEGSTYIFAQLDNGRFAVCKINVIPEPVIEEVPEISENFEEPAVEVTPTPTGEPIALEVSSTETSAAVLSVEEEPEETSEEETAEPESTDPFLTHSEEMDFETFIKNLNAANKSAASAESATGDAN